MSTNCDDCGYKNNEVKVGGAVSMHGKKITLKVTEKEDLSRDVLKVCNNTDFRRVSDYLLD
jgi:zinc finger protein